MPGAANVRQRNLEGAKQFRIISSVFPPVAIIERLSTPDDLEIAFAIESMTNDRVRAEIGDLYLVDKSEWVTGPGATVVMAAFTHIGRKSRFSDGSYGVYYAALDEQTAVVETVFHAERRLRVTNEPAIELDIRCYNGKVLEPLDDIRGKAFAHLRDPDMNTWETCQRFGAKRREIGSFGLLYKSARHPGGECVAGLRTKAVSRPTQSKHLRYCWNGSRIDRVMSVSNIQTL